MDCGRIEAAKVRMAVPPKRKTLWNSEDNERLKGMVASGVSVLKTAAAFKCTMSAARVQARKIGSPFPALRETRKKLADDPNSLWNSQWSQRRKSGRRPHSGAT